MTRLERDAARSLGVFQILDGSEMAVGEGGIGQGPEMLGRLELGRIRRQEEQVDMLGHTQPDARMPARTIEHQDNLLGRTCTHLAGELGQFHFKDGDAHRGRQMKDRAPGGRMDEADEVAPFEPVLHGRQRTLAVEAPHFVQDGL